jgi:hypothetical protein
MKKASGGKSERQLIDDTHVQQVMFNTMTQARRTSKSNEREEIIEKRQDESEEGKEDEKRDGCCLSLMEEKIGREELIESKGKRFGVELTIST